MEIGTGKNCGWTGKTQNLKIQFERVPCICSNVSIFDIYVLELCNLFN